MCNSLNLSSVGAPLITNLDALPLKYRKNCTKFDYFSPKNKVEQNNIVTGTNILFLADSLSLKSIT